MRIRQASTDIGQKWGAGGGLVALHWCKFRLQTSCKGRGESSQMAFVPFSLMLTFYSSQGVEDPLQGMGRPGESELKRGKKNIGSRKGMVAKLKISFIQGNCSNN